MGLRARFRLFKTTHVRAGSIIHILSARFRIQRLGLEHRAETSSVCSSVAGERAKPSQLTFQNKRIGDGGWQKEGAGVEMNQTSNRCCGKYINLHLGETTSCCHVFLGRRSRYFLPPGPPHPSSPPFLEHPSPQRRPIFVFGLTSSHDIAFNLHQSVTLMSSQVTCPSQSVCEEIAITYLVCCTPPSARRNYHFH